jgi:hypothetical protein
MRAMPCQTLARRWRAKQVGGLAGARPEGNVTTGAHIGTQIGNPNKSSFITPIKTLIKISIRTPVRTRHPIGTLVLDSTVAWIPVLSIAVHQAAGERRHVGIIRFVIRIGIAGWTPLRTVTPGGTHGASLGLRPGRCCSPRHRMPFNTINEGSKCVPSLWQNIARHVI